jgi:hypothetical protein
MPYLWKLTLQRQLSHVNGRKVDFGEWGYTSLSKWCLIVLAYYAASWRSEILWSPVRLKHMTLSLNPKRRFLSPYLIPGTGFQGRSASNLVTTSAELPYISYRMKYSNNESSKHHFFHTKKNLTMGWLAITTSKPQSSAVNMYRFNIEDTALHPQNTCIIIYCESQNK